MPSTGLMRNLVEHHSSNTVVVLLSVFFVKKV